MYHENCVITKKANQHYIYAEQRQKECFQSVYITYTREKIETKPEDLFLYGRFGVIHWGIETPALEKLEVLKNAISNSDRNSHGQALGMFFHENGFTQIEKSISTVEETVTYQDNETICGHHYDVNNLEEMYYRLIVQNAHIKLPPASSLEELRGTIKKISQLNKRFNIGMISFYSPQYMEENKFLFTQKEDAKRAISDIHSAIQIIEYLIDTSDINGIVMPEFSELYCGYNSCQLWLGGNENSRQYRFSYSNLLPPDLRSLEEVLENYNLILPLIEEYIKACNGESSLSMRETNQNIKKFHKRLETPFEIETLSEDETPSMGVFDNFNLSKFCSSDKERRELQEKTPLGGLFYNKGQHKLATIVACAELCGYTSTDRIINAFCTIIQQL